MPIYFDISSQVGEEDPVEIMMAKIKEMEMKELQRETEKEEERRRWLAVAKEIEKLEKLEKAMNRNLRRLEKDLQERQEQLEDKTEENKVLRELNMELNRKIQMFEERLRDTEKQNEIKYCEKILQMEKDFERQLEMATTQKAEELKHTVAPEKADEYVRQEENENRKTKTEKERVQDKKTEMLGINEGEKENKTKKDEGQTAHQAQREMAPDGEMCCHTMALQQRQERRSLQELERQIEMDKQTQAEVQKKRAKAKEVDRERANTKDLTNKQMEARQTEKVHESRVCDRAKAAAACGLEEKVITEKYVREEEKKKRKAEKEMAHEQKREMEEVKKAEGKGRKLLRWLAEKLLCGAGRRQDSHV